MRSIANHNSENPEADQAEVDKLEQQIDSNVRRILNAHYEQLKEELKVVKIEQKSDGNQKRAVASYLIDFLKNCGLEKEEIKGVMRQGYKIMRSN